MAELSPEVDARLSELLAQWARPRRLSAAQADAIREAILGHPGEHSDELRYEWWRVVMGEVASVVVEAREGSVGVQVGVQAGLSAIARSLWQSGLVRFELADTPGAYHPYLRLA